MAETNLMTNTERVVCHDCYPPQQDNSLMLAMANNNNWQNNPFMYLIWLAFFGGGNGFGWGNRADAAQTTAENYNSRQIAALQDSVNTNHNNDLAMQAINGNTTAISELAQTMNCDFSTMQQAVCGVKSAIEQVGGQVGYSAESVKNAIALGDANIMQQMQSCCCQTKTAILEQGYQGQLATERQTNVLSGQMAAQHTADQLKDCEYHGQTMSRIDQLANGIQQGFAQVGYAAQQNTQAIINNATANTQRILDSLCQQTTQQLRDSLAEKDRQLQTASIVAQLKKECGCNC